MSMQAGFLAPEVPVVTRSLSGVKAEARVMRFLPNNILWPLIVR